MEREPAVRLAAPPVVLNAAARFHAVEPIRVAAALGARCGTEPIRAAAKIPAVRPDVMVADRIVEAIRRASVADRIVAAFRCEMDDQLPCSRLGLALNAVNPRKNHAMGCCARFPASCALAAESARRFCIHFPAQDGQSELSGRPELGLAARSWHPCCVSERFDPATRFPVERRASDANRLIQPNHDSDCPRDQKPELGDVR